MASKFVTSVMAAAAIMSMAPATAFAADVRPGDSRVSAQAASATPVGGVQRQGAKLDETNQATPQDILGLILTALFVTAGVTAFLSESP